LRGGAFYANNHYGLNRSVSFPGFDQSVGSGYGGDTVEVFGEAGWRIAVAAPMVSAASVEPFLGVAGVDLHSASFAETPGPASLVGGSESTGYGITTLGLRGDTTMFATAPLTLTGMIGWQHVYGGATPNATFAFASAPSTPFSIAGAPIARDALAQAPEPARNDLRSVQARLAAVVRHRRELPVRRDEAGPVEPTLNRDGETEKPDVRLVARSGRERKGRFRISGDQSRHPSSTERAPFDNLRTFPVVRESRFFDELSASSIALSQGGLLCIPTVARKHATMITQALFQPSSTSNVQRASFRIYIAGEDPQRSYLCLSWRFTKTRCDH
jgi:Autotransporter beta-domain